MISGEKIENLEYLIEKLKELNGLCVLVEGNLKRLESSLAIIEISDKDDNG